MSTTTTKTPRRMHYEQCPVCEGRAGGCIHCQCQGYIATGITAGQVERLVEAAQRLDWREGDLAKIRNTPPKEPVVFIVTSVSQRGDVIAGEIVTHTRLTLIEAKAINCIRVGRIDRKDGEPC
jgi:hypothetical protein